MNVTLLGDNSASGFYVLRIQVRQDITLAFGKFRGGKRVLVPSGEYVYIGSALGNMLARRLIRHATRSGSKPPHPIRQTMLECFSASGLGKENLLPRNGKRLFWNIDHLLDLDETEIRSAIGIRTSLPLEREAGQLLLADPATKIIERGLGANDMPGNTHFLRVEADETWWERLPARLMERISDQGETDSTYSRRT